MAEKQITAIMMATPPAKTEYVVGFEGLDLTGGLLNLVYSDGSFEQVPLGSDMEYFVDNHKVGSANVTVRYAGLQAGFPIQVREPKLAKVTIISPPTKTAYLEGEEVSLAGLRLMGHYDNGQDREITPIPTISHRVQAGEAVVPLSIENILIPILIRVIQSKPVSIKMRNMPKKLSYIEVLEDLEVTGGMVEKRLNNGRIELVPLTCDMVSGFDNTKVGKQSLTVTYSGQSCTYDIEILARRCDKLELRSLPKKRVYNEGESFDLTGIELIAGEGAYTWTAPVDQLTLQDPVARAGIMSMIVDYQGQTVEFPITVKAKKLISISIKVKPKVISYREPGEKETVMVDPDGGMLELKYDNGETVTVPMALAAIDPISGPGVGERQVFVRYENFTATLSVNVTPRRMLGIYVSRQPHKTEYMAGNIFEPDGMVVMACYDDGKTSPIERYTCPKSPLQGGESSVIITYIDKTAVVPITVKEVPQGGGAQPSTAAMPLKRREPEKPAMPKAERFYPSTLNFRFSDDANSQN